VLDGFYESECFGDHPFISIYSINQAKKNVTLIQRLEAHQANILSVSLNSDHIVVVEKVNPDYFETIDTSIMVYQRENITQLFTFQESMNSSNYADGFGSQGLVFGDDLLVVGSNNYTHILSRQISGTWEETLTLNQTYSDFQVSGRTLIGITESEVHHMNIERYTQAVSTVAPSPAATAAKSTGCERVKVTFSCNPDQRGLGYSECIILYNDGFWESRIETSEFIPSDSKVVETFEPPDVIPTSHLADDSLSYLYADDDCSGAAFYVCSSRAIPIRVPCRK
jgi:hypothetical protein